MGRLKSCAAVVLCGGASSRMGRSKAMLKLGERTFLETIVATAAEVCSSVAIVAAPGQALPNLGDDVRIVHDSVAHQGPLSGMAAGFSAVAGKADYAFVTGTDTPLLKSALIETLFEMVQSHDIAIPFDGRRHHPLAAVYRTDTAARHAIKLLAENRRRPFFLLEDSDSVEVSMDRLAEVDPGLASFRNVNSPADYRAMLKDLGHAVPAEFRAPIIRTEFYGVARLKSGEACADFEAGTVAELVSQMTSRFPKLAGSVIVDGWPHSAYMLMRSTTERLTDGETPLKEGDTIMLLNMDAGG